jgi:hypothetical protein
VDVEVVVSWEVEEVESFKYSRKPKKFTIANCTFTAARRRSKFTGVHGRRSKSKSVLGLPTTDLFLVRTPTSQIFIYL